MNICVSVWVLASGGEDGRFDLFDEFSRLWYACRRDIKDSGCVDNLTIGWVLQKFRRISTTRSLCINKQDSTCVLVVRAWKTFTFTQYLKPRVTAKF